VNRVSVELCIPDAAENMKRIWRCRDGQEQYVICRHYNCLARWHKQLHVAVTEKAVGAAGVLATKRQGHMQPRKMECSVCRRARSHERDVRLDQLRLALDEELDRRLPTSPTPVPNINKGLKKRRKSQTDQCPDLYPSSVVIRIEWFLRFEYQH
jgi:hypothetical protein